MGMFDQLVCKYPLPIEGANALEYQTKDTPAQFLDDYEIREDGSLWHKAYDTEDRSRAAEWRKQNPGKEEPEFGWDGWIGCMTRVNERWEQVQFTGEIRFYTFWKATIGWIEFSAYFLNGALQQLNLLTHRTE